MTERQDDLEAPLQLGRGPTTREQIIVRQRPGIECEIAQHGAVDGDLLDHPQSFARDVCKRALIGACDVDDEAFRGGDERHRGTPPVRLTTVHGGEGRHDQRRTSAAAREDLLKLRPLAVGQRHHARDSGYEGQRRERRAQFLRQQAQLGQRQAAAVLLLAQQQR